MILELKESIPHGTKEYPYDQCHICNIRRHPFQFPVHWHDELEIIYIRQGSLSVCIEDQNYQGHAGSIFLVNPRELHYMGSDDKSVDYYTLLYPLEFISFQTMDDLETSLLLPLRSGQLLLTHEIADSALSETCGQLLERLVSLNSGNLNMRRQIETRILLLQFLSLLADYGQLLAPALSDNRPNLQRELLAYIKDHYTEKISLQDLSRQFHLSEKYLSRYFKEHFQLTFTSYTNHLRLTCARRLLENTKLPVTEIALRSGFPNVSYFIRVFKDSYGISPLKYRKASFPQ
ncbi:MAG: AraC family transcriptional regulator [Eubacteriales bacterium]|nr:AraC family transcriptional regulator [Eubacteriales bacterium]